MTPLGPFINYVRTEGGGGVTHFRTNAYRGEGGVSEMRTYMSRGGGSLAMYVLYGQIDVTFTVWHAYQYAMTAFATY